MTDISCFYLFTLQARIYYIFKQCYFTIQIECICEIEAGVI